MSIRSLLLATWLGVAGSAAAMPEIGAPAPDFSGIDTAGKTHALDDYRGKVVVLEWTNHDCPYVRKHYAAGNMQAQQRQATSQGAVWLSIISSAPGKQGHVSAAQADQLTKERDAAPSAVILDPDGTIGRLYNAKTTPHLFIIDAQGMLVYKGGIDSIASADRADIDRAEQYVPVALADVFAGRSVAKAVTRPYGCSVKY